MRFGTDGIRGRAGEDVTVELAYRLGRAVASVLGSPVVVGYDTRESSPELAAAVLAGAADGGVATTNLGVFTTPGVAVVARQRDAVGVVVSASHNPFRDNGLKVLGRGGAKLDRTTEAALEAALEAAPAPTDARPLPPADAAAEGQYVEHLRRLVPLAPVARRVVVDCANGAASHVAPALLAATGATVVALHDAPDGRNINEGCGSTAPGDLAAAVRAHGADLGFALDGDADRLICVDEAGAVRDGDDLLVLFALDRHERGLLGGGLAVTSMSNLGLWRALGAAGVEVVETAVGDRHVVAALEERGWRVGGEQSGHLIFNDLAPTGDGLLTALLVLDLVERRGPLGALARRSWARVPQALVNVAREEFDEARVRDLEAELAAAHDVAPADRRLVVRPSGTEPVVRVMVESVDGGFVEEFVARLRA